MGTEWMYKSKSLSGKSILNMEDNGQAARKIAAQKLSEATGKEVRINKLSAQLLELPDDENLILVKSTGNVSV